ncbi:hypothetical protein B0H13DRAFT_1876827 [Mycena leptocephala]|nr:hypothetical protein B0H13DRAFT_1876827 [Mycena leptocephala]
MITTTTSVSESRVLQVLGLAKTSYKYTCTLFPDLPFYSEITIRVPQLDAKVDVPGSEHFDPCPTQLIAGVPEPDSHEFRARRSGRSFHAGYVVQVPPSIPPSGAYPFLGAGFGAASLTTAHCVSDDGSTIAASFSPPAADNSDSVAYSSVLALVLAPSHSMASSMARPVQNVAPHVSVNSPRYFKLILLLPVVRDFMKRTRRMAGSIQQPAILIARAA